VPDKQVGSTVGELSERSGGVQRQLLKTQIVDLLREAIILGALRPETRLHEREISDQLGVSRLPVRDALHRLEGEGLVVSTPAGRQVLAIDSLIVRELVEFRLALELTAAESVARNPSPDDQQTFAGHVQEMRDALARDDTECFGRADLNLHQSIWQRAANRFVSAELNTLGRLLLALATRTASADVLALHERLVDRICAGDLDGTRRAVADHMATTLQECLASMDQAQTP
jgi:DNA-binding GntR family transcriptional regulator